jgi:hypothetical protein
MSQRRPLHALLGRGSSVLAESLRSQRRGRIHEFVCQAGAADIALRDARVVRRRDTRSSVGDLGVVGGL